MLKQKKIVRESWNAKVDEFIFDKKAQAEAEQNFLNNMMEEAHSSHAFASDKEEAGSPMFHELPVSNHVVFTPYGPHYTDSSLKPSNRWDCWVCYTNFDITPDILLVLEMTDGVEALKVMGRYTFFIGIGKLFSMPEVRADIERQLCEFTADEIISSMDINLRDTIASIQEQLSENNYWSIFVTTEGEIDYIISDTLDQKYMEALGRFEKRKYMGDGFILNSGENFYDEFRGSSQEY